MRFGNFGNAFGKTLGNDTRKTVARCVRLEGNCKKPANSSAHEVGVRSGCQGFKGNLTLYDVKGAVSTRSVKDAVQCTWCFESAFKCLFQRGGNNDDE